MKHDELDYISNVYDIEAIRQRRETEDLRFAYYTIGGIFCLLVAMIWWTFA